MNLFTDLGARSPDARLKRRVARGREVSRGPLPVNLLGKRRKRTQRALPVAGVCERAHPSQL
jgi:hypothetical protein